MPAPGRMACGEEMGRGPYEKAGLIRDTSLPPLRTITETFEMPFPYEDVKKGKKTVRNILVKEMDIDVELWYVPFGERKGPLSQWNQLWYKETKKVTID
ncbi:MAG: hypothetical protein AMJ45_05070 [Syntrophobacter sp. DG_60]|nr:MAG: hypothetical protein AMJ45_05070 [Syntrophobacter sp. DG_60]